MNFHEQPVRGQYLFSITSVTHPDFGQRNLFAGTASLSWCATGQLAFQRHSTQLEVYNAIIGDIKGSGGKLSKYFGAQPNFVDMTILGSAVTRCARDLLPLCSPRLTFPHPPTLGCDLHHVTSAHQVPDARPFVVFPVVRG